MNVVSVKVGTTVAPREPENSRLGIGKPIAALSQIPPPTPTDRLHPGLPEIARPCIGRPIASQSPASQPLLTPDIPLVGPWYKNDSSDPLDFSFGGRRWYIMGYSERYWQSEKMISKERTNMLRSEPNFHDIDGACPWTLVLVKVMRKFPKVGPKTNAEERLEELKMGSNRVRFQNCWHKHDDDTLVQSRAIQGHCSRLIVSPEFFQNVIECPHGWTHVIHHSSSQQYLDTHVLIAGRTGTREADKHVTFRPRIHKDSKAIPNHNSRQPQLVPYVHNTWHTDAVYETHLVSTQYGLQLCLCSLRRHSSRMYCKCRRIRSDDLVWKTIRSRTAITGDPTRCPCIGWPVA